VALINAGKAQRIGDRYFINDRIYGTHGGTLYPVSGPGLHQLDRGAFKALGVFNRFGDTQRAAEVLDMMGIDREQREAALRAWRAVKGA
jgi:hypothetical protein